MRSARGAAQSFDLDGHPDQLDRIAELRVDRDVGRIAAVRDHVSTEFLELGPAYRFANPEGTARFAALSAEAHRQAPTRQASGIDVTWQALRDMTRPALLVTGEADLYAPPPLQEMVAAHLPNAQTRAMRAVGHAAYWEAPDAFNDLVLEFLGRHRG